MRRLTLKNLLARKVRLIMSTLSIVLGVGFLTGVLTFSNGLQSTFDGIIEGSTSDGLVRAKGAESFADQGPSSNVALTPADVERIKQVPEVKDSYANVEGMGMYLLDPDKKLVGGTGAPTIAFNQTDALNLAGEPALLIEKGTWPTKPGEIAIDAGSAERAGYEIGDTVSFIPPFAKPPIAEATLVGTANFNGGGTAGATLVIFDTKGAQQIFLNGKDAFTSVSLTAADGVSQKQLVSAVKKVLPEQFTAVTGDTVVEESKASVGQFLSIITQFLIVFALIAIVVGAFIIANTFNILVAQRVRELALLRALGASRRQVTRSVLLEAFVM
ncbi:MAG: FtsX-like permease family protein, partial [Myxococcales bacterium]